MVLIDQGGDPFHALNQALNFSEIIRLVQEGIGINKEAAPMGVHD